VYKESKKQYEQEFGSNYERPGFGARILAGVIRILPKVGKLRSLKFIAPSPEAQALFRQSFHQTVLTYCDLLDKKTLAADRVPQLPNTDFDTGHPTKLGEYPLADRTYGEWVRDLAKDDFKNVSASMQQNILRFFADPPKAPLDKEELEKDKLRETEEALTRLKSVKPKS
jgi:hypothetical protein